MESTAGIIIVLMMLLWLLYILPARLKSRQDHYEAKTDERFSPRMRVLAVVGKGHSLKKRTAHQRRSSCNQLPIVGSAQVPRGESKGMKPEEVEFKNYLRSQYSRRQAAARRRARLAGGLLASTLILLAVSWFGTVSLRWAVMSFILFATVLFLGRRSAVQQQAIDARYFKALTKRYRGNPASLHNQVEDLNTRIMTESEVATVIALNHEAESVAIPAVKDQVFDFATTESQAESTPEAGESSSLNEGEQLRGREWSPMPVPRPLYTLKPAVVTEAQRPVTGTLPRISIESEAHLGSAQQLPSIGLPTPTMTLCLDEVLARRSGLSDLSSGLSDLTKNTQESLTAAGQ